MKKTFIILAGILGLYLQACETGLEGEIQTTPAFTGADAYNDVTFWGDQFYTTNYDYAEGPGVRTNLYTFNSVGSPVASFTLPLNSQGYISISAQGANLCLLCQVTGLLLKVSPFGDLAALNMLPNALMDWQRGGLLATEDSLLVLLWNYDGQIQVYPLSPNDLVTGSMQNTLTISNRLGFRSLCSNSAGDSLYLLCSDPDGAEYINLLNLDWVVLNEYALSDSLIAGITYSDGMIWGSTEDRRLIPILTP